MALWNPHMTTGGSSFCISVSDADQRHWWYLDTEVTVQSFKWQLESLKSNFPLSLSCQTVTVNTDTADACQISVNHWKSFPCSSPLAPIFYTRFWTGTTNLDANSGRQTFSSAAAAISQLGGPEFNALHGFLTFPCYYCNSLLLS